MGMMRLVAVVLVVATMSSRAEAVKTLSGNELKKSCEVIGRESKPRYWGSTGFCFGYVGGVMHMMESVRSGCPPRGVTFRQASDVVMKWMNDHPEKLHLGGRVVVTHALGEAWPCKK